MSLLSHLHPSDITIILLFLAANIIVGFWSRGRNRSFTEFAIGDKKFSTPVLTATIVATWLAGGLFFIVLERYLYQRPLLHHSTVSRSSSRVSNRRLTNRASYE